MSRALIIKNADFSLNKVATITFTDIECEGITLAESSITIDDRQGSVLTYTVTPQNTTDPVRWTSSDESVLKVVSGSLIVVGVGDCDITARCGKNTATCHATVDIYETPHFTIGNLEEVDLVTEGKMLELSATASTSNIVTTAIKDGYNGFSEALSVYGVNSTLAETEIITCIKIPKHVKYMHVYCKSIYRSNPGYVIYFFNDSTPIAHPSYPVRNGYKQYKKAEITPPNTLLVNDYVAIPDDAVGYLIRIRMTPSTIVTDNVSTYSDLVDVYENTLEGSIHYLAELPDGAEAIISV